MIEQAVLTCEALGEAAVIRVRGAEAMNELSRWTVDVLSSDEALDPAKVVATNAALSFADGGGGQHQPVSLKHP